MLLSLIISINFDLSGRLLNRFGKNVETVKIDSSLAGSFQAVNTSLAGFFVTIIMVA